MSIADEKQPKSFPYSSTLQHARRRHAISDDTETLPPFEVLAVPDRSPSVQPPTIRATRSPHAHPLPSSESWWTHGPCSRPRGRPVSNSLLVVTHLMKRDRIQVMSEPRKLRKSRMRFKAFRTFSLPLLEPKTPPPLTASEKPLRAGHLDLTASTTRHDESEGEAPEHFVPIVAERHDSESLHHGTSPDEGESTATVAYIHFRNEWDRAFPVLHSIEPNHADETGPLVASTR